MKNLRINTYLLLLLLLCVSIDANAQNFTISYQLTYRSDSVQADSIKQSNYKLDILGSESIFRTENRKISDSLLSSGKFGFGYNLNPFFELYFTKDLKQEVYSKYFVLPLSRDKFIINITEPLDWKILPETAVIADLNCQKAEVKYAGRNWTAWFTKQIAVSEGPYYFHGLPGLILQIRDDDDNFVFNLTEIKNLTENTLYETKDGIEITWNQYEKQLQTFYKDPYTSIRVPGMKVYTDNNAGGYKEIDYRSRIKQTREMLLKNDNPIELDHKINYR